MTLEMRRLWGDLRKGGPFGGIFFLSKVVQMDEYLVDGIEDMFLMGRFEQASSAASALCSSHARTSELDHRILSILIQSMVKCKRSEDLGVLLDGRPTLPLELFLIWQLSLIEAGHAEEARGRIEAHLALLQPNEEENEERSALCKCLALIRTNASSLENCFTMTGVDKVTGSFNDIISQSHQAKQQENESSYAQQARQVIKTLQWLPIPLVSQRKMLISVASALFLFSLVAERKALTAALKQWWRQIRAFLRAFVMRAFLK